MTSRIMVKIPFLPLSATTVVIIIILCLDMLTGNHVITIISCYLPASYGIFMNFENEKYFIDQCVLNATKISGQFFLASDISQNIGIKLSFCIREDNSRVSIMFYLCST